jgi:tRNA nucleotidyltransferase (CCA-adding enzyme)
MNHIDKIVLPYNVGYVINKLNTHGFDAFIVGGCVRDSILGREPNDWDVTTNALPQDIKNIFDKTYDTGIKHGTVSVAVNGENIEVTTYRIDGDYSDHRRPDIVKFTSSLKEDLARRDFTVNAIAYHTEKGLIDPFNGLKDLEDKLLRAVGNAENRFDEDALRMLRTVRFSAQLNFTIERSTYSAVKKSSELIKNVSSERIRDELTKILISKNPMHFNYLYETGLLQHIIPEFESCYNTRQNNPYHVYNVADHIMHTVESVSNTAILRWTMLLHDIGKPSRLTTDDKGVDHFYGHQEVSAELAEVILNRLKFDRESIRKITRLISFHDIDIFDTDKSVRKVISKVGEDLFLELLEVQRADAMAQNKIYLDNRMVKMDNIIEIYRKIKQENQCLKISDMAINGYDLIDLGIKPGKDIGKMLEYLFEYVLENPDENNKQTLIKLAKSGIM